MVSAFLTGLLLAVRAMRRNVLRASLTVLGLLIGVAAVVMVAGVTGSARQVISNGIQSLGSNLIIIAPEETTVSGARGGKPVPGRLTEDDVLAISREAGSVVAVAPMLTGKSVIVNGDRNVTTTVHGSTAPFLAIRTYKLARGDLWNPTEEVTRARVCILGATVNERLFGREDAVGRTIRIGRSTYTVVGVLRRKGELMGVGDQDDLIIMPIGSMTRRILHSRAGAAGVIVASATSAQATDRAVREIEAILRQRHHVEGRAPDFKIVTQKRVIEMQELVSNALTGFLVAVAAISLVVGGIGVMNIMLVSVTERTQEIGIRLAVGARARDVEIQFLVEAVALSLVGGVLGAAVGAGGLGALSLALGWPIKVSATALLAGVVMSTVTGIVFGFAPARRAARLDPIEALRYE